MENKDLMTVNQGLDFSNPEIIKTLKQTVAIGTTDTEFAMFLELCKSSGLNPFKKEIWCIVVPGKEWTDYKTGQTKKKERQVQMMGGINGFYEIANQDPRFDGLEKGLIGKNGEYLPSTYPKEDYIGAWTKVYIKSRKVPQEETAFLSEFAKDFGNWKTMRRIMIQKCSDALALRKSCPQKLNGLYIPEEMPQGYELKEDKKALITASVVIADNLPEPQKQVVSSDLWTGEEIIQGGKNAKKKWKDLSGDSIEWYIQNSKNPQIKAMAQKEADRRSEAEYAVHEKINEEAAKAQDDFDRDELPDFQPLTK